MQSKATRPASVSNHHALSPRTRACPKPFTRTLLAAALACASLAPMPAHAAGAPSVTVLGAYPSTVPAGGTVELLATVESGSNSVPFGVVQFCDATKKSCTGTALLGQSELTNTVAPGNAAVFLRLAIGVHQVKAVFLPQNGIAGSVSSTQTVTVTGTHATSTALAATGAAGNYTLTGTVSSAGRPAATGSLSFLDTSDSNFSLGSAVLNGGKTSVSFAQQQIFYVGDGPLNLVSADFDGDGFPDIALVNYYDSSVQVIYGDGKGSSSYSYQIHVTGANNLAVGDFNGDGIPDLAVTDTLYNQVHILQFAGDRSFGEVSVQNTNSDPEYIAVGDFNGDGTLDLLISNDEGGYMSYLAGTGYGAFDPPSKFICNTIPGPAAVGDFNGDGKLDFAVGTGSGLIGIWLGNGNGTFTDVQTLYAGSGPRQVVVGDFDGDGNPDLAAISPLDNLLTVFLGSASGTFSQKAVYSTGASGSFATLAEGDFDGDGHADLAFLVSDSLAGPSNPGILGSFLGKGDGTFTYNPVSVSTNDGPAALVAADWDGDGISDLGLTNSGSANVETIHTSASTLSSAVLNHISIPGGGTHYVVASYAGAAGEKGSRSASAGLAGSPIKTATALAVSPGATVTLGQTLQFTGSVTPGVRSDLTDTGSVRFLDGTKILATVTLVKGQAVLSINSLAVGAHSITAVYSGDANFVTSTSAATVVTVSGPPAATPAFTPAPGAYTGKQSITLKDATVGAVMYYTTDGSTPSTASTRYTGAITIAVTTTIKAIATAPNDSPSAVAIGTYTIH